jgi:OmpA-OmpF porin, OOP family
MQPQAHARALVALLAGLSLAACREGGEAARAAATPSSPTLTLVAAPAAAPAAAEPAAGLDIEPIPVANPPTGPFPYVGLLQGYQERSDKKDVDYDRYEFFDGTRIVPVEGRLMSIVAEGGDASAVEILRNYERLITGLGGVKVFEGQLKAMYQKRLKFSDPRYREPLFATDHLAVFKLSTPEKTVWYEAYARGGLRANYVLTAVETTPLNPKAGLLPAEEMKQALDAKGHVTLYVNFDFDKATIQPDSQPVIDEVAKLLRTNPGLKLRVEGHTDNVGAAAYNRTLSEARARSVVAALTGRGIGGLRLSAAGYGPDRPIADNGADAGRASNRRVELVKV